MVRENENPVDYFNRVLGNRTGNRQLPRGQGSGHTYIPSTVYRPQRVRRIAGGNPLVSPNLTKDYNRQLTGMGGSRSGYSPQLRQDVMANVYDEAIKEYQQLQAEQNAVARENAEQAKEEEDGEGIPWWRAAFLNPIAPWVPFLTNGDAIGDSGFQGSPVGRTLDVVSRPSYGLFEGLQSLAEIPESGQGFNPSDLGAAFREFGQGIGRGLTGENKTGFGQVYESYKNNPDTAFGPGLSAFEEAHPNWEQALAITAGAAGEIFLDPLNLATPANPAVIRKGLQGAGRVATAPRVEAMLTDMARIAVDDISAANFLPTGSVYRNNPQLLFSKLSDSILDVYNHSALNVAGGGKKGLKLMNGKTWPRIVTERAVETIKQAIIDPFTRHVTRAYNMARNGTLTVASADAYRAVDQDFDEFFTLLAADLGVHTTDDVIRAINNGLVPQSKFDEIFNIVTTKYDGELMQTRDIIFSGLRNPTYKTVGVRVAGKEIPFKFVGRAYQWGMSKLDGALPNRGNMLDDIFVENIFPGVFGGKISRARALGFFEAEKMFKQIQDMARKFSPEQARQMQDYIDTGFRTGDQQMDNALDWIKAELDRLIKDEYDIGARSPSSIKGNNYTPIYTRGGTRDARALFKAQRKAAIQATGRPGQWDLKKARELGLKPMDSIFDNLWLRYQKSMRDRTRALFLNDLVDNYAVHGTTPVRMSKNARVNRNLHRLSKGELNEVSRAAMDAQGGNFYLPEEIYKMYETFKKITEWSPNTEMNQIGNGFAKAMSAWKQFQTLFFPGFHNKNIIGDIFMGILDDVPPQVYGEVVTKYGAVKAGKAPRFNIIKGVLDFDAQEFYKVYNQNANTSFMSIDLGVYPSLTAGNIPKRIGSFAIGKLRHMSDLRESFGRFAHFLSAYRQEARALWNKGVRNLDEIKRLATEAAIFRVNGFKFDYSALTTAEKKIKTLAFPFYTYLRKAAPLLVQQMYLNPKWFAIMNRFMEYNDGSAADHFNHLNISQYMRDAGFAALSDENEPWMMSANILPFGALEILNSGSLEELGGNVVQGLGPAVLAPFELGAGETYYDENNIDNPLEYLTSNIPLIGEIQSELGLDIPGIPGNVGGPTEHGLGQLISNRLAGLGLPIQKLSEGQQLQQHNTNIDNLIEGPIQDFNYSQDVYHISWSDDMTQFRVRNKLSGEIIGVFPTAAQAIRFAQGLPTFGYQDPQIGPNALPTMKDIQVATGINP